MKNNIIRLLGYISELLDRYPKIKAQIRYLIHFPGGAGEFAWSSALGAFIGVAVPEGLQTVTSIGAAYLFRMNFLILTFFTLITNPFTIIPIYYTSFRVGEWITGKSVTAVQIENLFSNPGITSALELGTEGVIIFLTGSFLHGVFWGGVVFAVMYVLYPKLKKLRIKN